jgi:hypothetical protein
MLFLQWPRNHLEVGRILYPRVFTPRESSGREIGPGLPLDALPTVAYESSFYLKIKRTGNKRLYFASKDRTGFRP